MLNLATNRFSISQIKLKTKKNTGQNEATAVKVQAWVVESIFFFKVTQVSVVMFNIWPLTRVSILSNIYYISI